MKVEFDNDLLLRTVVETDTELSKWVQRLSSDHYLELGDDRSLVDDIERDLQNMARRVRQLEPQFDLSQVPLSKANKYFVTTESLNTAMTLVHTIRKKACGSQQNTQQCISHLEACAESVRDLASYASLAG